MQVFSAVQGHCTAHLSMMPLLDRLSFIISIANLVNMVNIPELARHDYPLREGKSLSILLLLLPMGLYGAEAWGMRTVVCRKECLDVEGM